MDVHSLVEALCRLDVLSYSLIATLVVLVVAIVFLVIFFLKNRSHKVQYDALQKKISTLAAEKEGKDDKIATLQQANTLLEAEKKGKDDEIATLQQANTLLAAEKEGKDIEIEKWKEKLDDLEKDMERVKKEKTYLEQEKNDEIERLKGNLSQAQREQKTLKQDLTNTTSTLEVKEKSLSFVKDVLLAQETKECSELESAVTNIKQFVTKELQTFCQAHGISWDEDLEKKMQNWADAAKKPWLKNKTVIAFVGEFSAGKTSIVNRILSQDAPNVPLLPVCWKPTTAIPTYISRGATNIYQFYSPDNKLKTISEDTFTKVSKEVFSKDKWLLKLITHFVIQYKNLPLDNLSILDTPGFDSNDQEDDNRTREVINECDALFWVIDAHEGNVNRTSLSIIKEHLKKPLYIVINKIDQKSKKEVDSIEALIKKELAKEQVPVQQFIRFSKKSQLKDIMEPISSVTHDIARDNYIDTLYPELDRIRQEVEQKVNEANDELDETERQYKDDIVAAVNNRFDDLKKDGIEEFTRVIETHTRGFITKKYCVEKTLYNTQKDALDKVAIEQRQALKKRLCNDDRKIVSELKSTYKQKADAEQTKKEFENLQNEFVDLMGKYENKKNT